MFIDKLNDAERQILINLMMLLAKVDNRFSNREASHMLEISKKYDLVMIFNLDKSAKEICSDIKCDQSRIIIIQELVWAAKVDSDYCPEEQKFIKDIMAFFDIGLAKYTKIMMWVDKGISWKKEGLEILSV